MTSDTLACDLVVVGSGAAGLSAAVTAAHLGLEVIIIEKEAQIGGTSAWSGGWLWVPRNPLAVAGGIVEDIEAPLTYLRAELGNDFDEALCRQFLTQAPRMIRFMQEQTALDFVDGNVIPDFHHQSEGAATGGRSVCAAPFDARALGARVKDLKPPPDLVAPFGMGIASGADLRHFLNATRKWASFQHVAMRMVRHMRDLVLHRRGMHLVGGNALVARLLKSADEMGVRILLSSPATGLIMSDEGVAIGVSTPERQIIARRGVVLATGGFPHDQARKARLFPHDPKGDRHFSAAPSGNSGDGLRLGERIGARIREDFPDSGAWAPVSLVPGVNGSVEHFPHLIERAKPGLIMVRQNGQRFVNEANSYHDVMRALFAATPMGEQPECWMICDHAFLRRFGLGRVRPRPFPIRPWLKNGYLLRGETLKILAERCGIDAVGLEETVQTVNRDAADGVDRAFGRGEGPYNRLQGDADHSPNPCVRELGTGPFYALRILPGSLGTFAGLATGESARVLDQAGDPIAGLYAVGNDMASMMRGRYPSGGITLGPGMTFGFIAAHHAAGVPLENE